MPCREQLISSLTLAHCVQSHACIFLLSQLQCVYTHKECNLTAVLKSYARVHVVKSNSSCLLVRLHQTLLYQKNTAVAEMANLKEASVDIGFEPKKKGKKLSMHLALASYSREDQMIQNTTAILELYQSYTRGIQSYVRTILELYQSYTRAILELHQSYTRAMLELYQSHTRAILELHQSYARAILELHQSYTRLELYQSYTRAMLELHQIYARATLGLHQSYARATLELYQSYARAILELYQSYTRATLELHQSYTRAILKLHQSYTRAYQSCFFLSSACCPRLRSPARSMPAMLSCCRPGSPSLDRR